MRQSTLTTFGFKMVQTEQGEKRLGGVRHALPGSFEVFTADDLKKAGPDETRGCGYSVYFVPTQGISPRKDSGAANNGVLMLVLKNYDEENTEGEPVVDSEELCGIPLLNANGFPMYVARKQMAAWRSEFGETKRQTLRDAINRQFGSHADSNGLLCYGAGMPESVTRPAEILGEFRSCLAYCERRGKGLAEAVADARYILKQRKNRSDGTTWDRYLANDGTVTAEPAKVETATKGTTKGKAAK